MEKDKTSTELRWKVSTLCGVTSDVLDFVTLEPLVSKEATLVLVLQMETTLVRMLLMEATRVNHQPLEIMFIIQLPSCCKT
ncbi:hypothetical protein RJT34_30155 [Clitoria ternatea]|uniref:Uncharacterized protein n=1 Tax=Clitoria ternatea TaxID=43366 RepID=A0AAN9ESK0_CLITE